MQCSTVHGNVCMCMMLSLSLSSVSVASVSFSLSLSLVARVCHFCFAWFQIMNPDFFVSKKVLLQWLLDFFQISYTKVEEAATGKQHNMCTVSASSSSSCVAHPV